MANIPHWIGAVLSKVPKYTMLKFESYKNNVPYLPDTEVPREVAY